MAAPIFLLGPDPSNQCCGCETRSGPCDPCAGCLFTLPFSDGLGPQPPFATQAEAQAEIDNQTNGCLSRNQVPNSDYDSISVSFGAGILSMSEQQSSAFLPNFQDVLIFRISAQPGTLDIPFTITMNQVYDFSGMLAILYEDDGTTVSDLDLQFAANATVSSGTLHLTVPTAGFYYLVINISATNASSSFPAVFTLNSATVTGPGLQVCTVRAAYDDGSGVQYVDCSTI